MNSLRDFVTLLERNGELIRIKEFVSIDREIAEVTDRISKSKGGGKALLFENNETAFPVLTNMLGSEKRISLALRVDKLEDLTKNIDDLFAKATSPKLNFMDKLKMLPVISKVSKWLPKNSSSKGACQQVILKGNDIDLFSFPILQCNSFDGGRFITLPLVNSIDPETSQRNVGMYRMQILSKNKTALHWHKHKTGEKHYTKYKNMGELMPVSVCIGGDPSYTYSATAPLPDGIDEYILAGFIRNKPVELVKCITNNLRVPSDCDFVIEGYVDTSKSKVIEGPFGDHTGFYSLEDYYPVFNVTCITHRKNAIYPATIVGIPPMEDSYIGMATERIFLSPIKAVLQPEIKAMFLPIEGIAHNIAIFDIEKSYAGQGLKVANAMWGAGQMMFNKFIIITSSIAEGIHNIESLKEPLRNLDLKNGILTTVGPLDVLDHSCETVGFGGKMCIDLSERVEEESVPCQVDFAFPSSYKLPKGVIEVSDVLLKERWSILLVKLSREIGHCGSVIEKLMSDNVIKGVKFVFVFDPEQDISDYPTLTWIAGNNINPALDAHFYDEYVVLDARSKFPKTFSRKRDWPNVVTQDQETILNINNKWNSLCLGDFIESPSLKYSKIRFKGGAKVEE